MKKHGHYCKVCGEYKANEKFSGKGYAAHICKKCAALPPDVRSAQMIENKLLSLPWRLSKEQIKWLNNKTHDKRPEIRELAQEQLNMRFHPERLAPDDSDEFEDLLLNEDDDEDERKQAEEDAKKAAEEAAASGTEQPKENKVTKYAAGFLGVVALIALAAGGGFYVFTKQKQKKQAEKEALDPDADYTEDNGNFEIPPEDDSDEDTSEEQDVTPI